jgi:small subunit ribosomal protein S20
MPAPSKRDRQDARKFVRNRGLRTRLRNLSRDFYKAVQRGDLEHAERLRNVTQSELDKAATKGVIHPNRASRSVSRYDRALDKAKSAA